MAEVAKIKGAALAAFLHWYEARYGVAKRIALGRTLPPEHAELIWLERESLGVIESDWYPSSLAGNLLDVMAKDLGDNMMPLLSEATQQSVERLTRGLYSVLFRMIASPKLYATHVQRAWRMLHTTGERKMVFLDPSTIESTVGNWPGHHPWLCYITTETMRATFAAMGCKRVTVDRVACIGPRLRANSPIAQCRAIVKFTA